MAECCQSPDANLQKAVLRSEQGPPCFCQSPHSVPLLGLQVKPTRSQRSTSVAFSFLEISTSIDPSMESGNIHSQNKPSHHTRGRIKMCQTQKVCQILKPFFLGDMFFFRGVIPEVAHSFFNLP